jgi:hypothetical protein
MNMNTQQNEFQATVRDVAPLVGADMGEALGELKYVSVTFAIEGDQDELKTLVRAEFKEPEKFLGSGLERADNAPVEGYLVHDGVFTASLAESPELVEGAIFPVKVSAVSED